MNYCVSQIFELRGMWEPASSGVGIQLYNDITCDIKCILSFSSKLKFKCFDVKNIGEWFPWWPRG